MFSKPKKLPGSAVDRLSATYNYLMGKTKDPSQRVVDSTLNRDVRDMLVPEELRQEMSETLADTARQGLCSARISEASQRIEANQYLVTRRECWFLNLVEEDLILALSVEGNILDSDELPLHWNWHLGIYQENPQINAIILGQPAAVMALAEGEEQPEGKHLTAAVESLGGYKICKPDIRDISFQGKQVRQLIIPRVGVLSLGENMVQAAANLDLINKLGEITLRSR